MKTHKEINEQLAGFVLGELSEEQTLAVEKHLAECEQCRNELEQLQALLECAGHISKTSVDEATCESVKQTLFATIASQETKAQTVGSNIGPTFIWRTIMKSKITRLAAAAVIIIAVLAGINYFGGSIDGAGVAWAGVAEKVEQIHNYVFRMRQIETSGPKKEGFEFISETEMIMYNSSEYGNKTESYKNGELMTSSFSLRQQKLFIGICPPLKSYERRPLSEAQLIEMDQMNPRKMVKRFMAADYKELGFETINGTNVEGIEVYDPKVLREYPPPIENFVARLWVDVQTELPVWLELEFTPKGLTTTTKLVIDQFTWDANLDASDFKPNIPQDYTPEVRRTTVASKPREDVAGQDETSDIELPNLEKLNLLGIQEDLYENSVPLVGMMEIWKTQDEFVRSWPVYPEVQQQLYEELSAKLKINSLSKEQFVATAVALREKFWQAGGCLSKTSYPYGYAARVLLETAHQNDPADMTVTDKLVETIQSIELAWMYETETDEQIRNVSLRNASLELRSAQFEQIKTEVEQGQIPTWEDFVRVNDLVILLGFSEDYSSGLEAVDWLIGKADSGGWTAYMKPLEKMQLRFNENKRFYYNILRRTKSEFPEEFRYGRRLPSFKGPKKFNATPLHILEPNPVWHGL